MNGLYPGTSGSRVGLGAKAALIERRLRGGDCLNIGCVSFKATIRSGRVALGVPPERLARLYCGPSALSKP